MRQFGSSEMNNAIEPPFIQVFKVHIALKILGQ